MTSPEAFGALVRHEREVLGRLVREIGLAR
jgi:hypothetical protein